MTNIITVYKDLPPADTTHRCTRDTSFLRRGAAFVQSTMPTMSESGQPV